MAPRKGRRIEAGRLPDLGLETLDIRDFGADDFPPEPKRLKSSADPYEMGLPEGCAQIVELARTKALTHLDRKRNPDGNLRGVGLGLRTVGGESTGEYCLQFLAFKKLPPNQVPAGCLLPKTVDFRDHKILVDLIEAPGDVQWSQRPCPAGVFEPSSCASASISNVPDGVPGGTLGGTWRRLDNSGQRGLTNAHLAITPAMAFQDFVAGLPGSLARLFESPRGNEIYTASPFLDNFEIMEVDTLWPILAPWLLPVPVAGAVPLLFLDCAAGDVDHRPIPTPFPLFPPPPPPQESSVSGMVAGGRIRSARPPIPGTAVLKRGIQTGLTFGTVRIGFLQLALALGPLIVIFDQILSELTIANGDSGSSLLSDPDNHYLGSCWGGLPLNGPPVALGGGGFMLDHTLSTPAHQIFWRMNLNLY